MTDPDVRELVDQLDPAEAYSAFRQLQRRFDPAQTAQARAAAAVSRAAANANDLDDLVDQVVLDGRSELTAAEAAYADALLDRSIPAAGRDRIVSVPFTGGITP